MRRSSPPPDSRLLTNLASAVVVLKRTMSTNFHKLQALHRARKEKVDSRMAAMDKAEADFQERVTQMRGWFFEARQDLRAAQDQLDECWSELLLKQADIETAQEEAKEKAAKDEEIEKLAAQRTQDLMQKHQEALDALVLDHAGKLKEPVDRAEAAEAARVELADKA